jgi:hypothetical protein
MERPLWLPDMESVEGPVEDVLRRLFKRFLADFDASECVFQGLPVRWDQATVDVAGRSYHRGFWHLVSREDQKTGLRRFDQRRAERLPWCAPLLTNAHDDSVLVWEYREGHGRLRTYVWLRHWSYVVVLEAISTRTGEVMQLVTAFHVDGSGTERGFRRKYDRRIR